MTLRSWRFALVVAIPLVALGMLASTTDSYTAFSSV